MAIKSYMKDGKKLFLVEIKIRNSDGKQLYRSRQGISSERKAQEAEFQLRKELENVATGKPSTDWMEWVEHCIRRMKPTHTLSTVENYDGILSKWVHPSWKEKSIQDITRSDIHQLIFEDLGDLTSSHTKGNILKMVKRVLQMACEEGILDRNPCTGLSVKHAEAEQKVLTSQEVEQFLREAKTVNHRFYPVWAMALMTGMRSGELFALQWADVDFDNKLIRVNKAWNSKVGITPTKTRKNRVVPISEDLLTFLKGQKLQSGSASPFVLPRLWEWEQGEQALITRDFCIAAGVTSVKFHDLRATFITNLLSKGVSLARVMAIVGHSEIRTTNGYLRRAGVDIQGSTEELGYSLPSEIEGKVLKLSGVWKNQ